MIRKKRSYPDCIRSDCICVYCSRFKDGLDCHGRPFTALEKARREARMTQQQLADATSVDIRRIQQIEAGEFDPGRLIARKLLALAEALHVDPRDLIYK